MRYRAAIQGAVRSCFGHKIWQKAVREVFAILEHQLRKDAISAYSQCKKASGVVSDGPRDLMNCRRALQYSTHLATNRPSSSHCTKSFSAFSPCFCVCTILPSSAYPHPNKFLKKVRFFGFLTIPAFASSIGSRKHLVSCLLFYQVWMEVRSRVATRI